MSYEVNQALKGLTLGKTTDYRDLYDASLLQGVPRSLNRDPLGLSADALPFDPADPGSLTSAGSIAREHAPANASASQHVALRATCQPVS